MDAEQAEHMEGLCVTDCTRCPALVDSRSRIVDGTGPADADVLFVGEAPGAQEDATGEPFVGRSGTVLDDQLRTVGLERESVRITNCVRCRPPDNRDPTTDELENCRGYLEAEIDRVDPDVVVTLGKVPSEHLLERSVAVTSETGSVEEVRLGEADTPRPVLICLHPAATLYDRSQESAFAETIQEAAAIAGVSPTDEGGQSRLGEY
ncbi:phage SPO1 DNA polymerase-like protein [Halovivax asiaticus JCM 14624]|uniref:Type-4 uracil-DNA glycosylase n=1 Tax=Halovivax asiaticus JCM 14624 TaxID=1227490 RepID=M0BIU9_9EURY|nr:uracil-DNA glycosylase [Halovivax asiaticus]ELZ10826.1 phage SPO1 DNA polymerase-like protein [Halovivax asiaticus JCM 14624]